MKTLIEDYKRRLATITEMIETTSDTGSRNDIAKMARLKAKEGEYRTFIAELEREYRNYITSKLDALMSDYKENVKGGGSAGTLRALLLLTVELAKDMGIEVELDFVDCSYTIK